MPGKRRQSTQKKNGEKGLPQVATNSSELAIYSVVSSSAQANSDTSLDKLDGDVPLYPVLVKTQRREKFMLLLSPEASVMNVRQMLLDVPETCFLTCYSLLLHEKDGCIHKLEDHMNQLFKVADITSGCCILEMVDALYDDRSIRAHIHRTRELLLSSTPHSSLSTMLALQQKTRENISANSEESVKVEVLEPDILGLVGNDSIRNLLSSHFEESTFAWSVDFSSFNPPPSHRRLSGDLIYLDVTVHDYYHCITGTTKEFYVNSSKQYTFDPKPHKYALKATSLFGLLETINSKFKEDFDEILQRKASAHPFENVQSPLSLNSWLGVYPVPDHQSNATRAHDSSTLSFGSEFIGMQRDWNGELQSCRELPHTTNQESILRDRALYKATSDFVDAATSGAIGVIRRCISPINPADPESFHIYVHNNIFFSHAVDADLEQLIREQAPDVDTQLATYGSTNNELKGTLAYQEADVPGLYTFAMAIIDYRGHRVVAQSVLPGILQGDISDSLLYGSCDNGKKICWSEEFHSKVLEAAKRLHLKEHSVLDGAGNVFKLASSVECKGIVGSDDRHYIFDLMRVTPRDFNYTGPGSKFFILRPELISDYCHADEKFGKENSQECGSHPKIKDSSKEIFFNPNVFTEFKLSGTEEGIYSDEEDVRKASLYLKDVVLPKFIQDLCTLEVSPMDGQSLTEALHAHGINVRYIGNVAEGTRHMPHLWDLCSCEMVVRSAKHIVKDILRNTEEHDLGLSISHIFNCFVGEVISGKNGKEESFYLSVTSDSLWADIRKFAKLKYQFELPEDIRQRVRKFSVIRNLCQKVGITIAGRKYVLDDVSPFQVPDILNIQPLVKHCVPVPSKANDLIEAGKVQLAKGILSEAYARFNEAYTILERVTGPMHRDVANCCRYLAMSLYHKGDVAGAIKQQQNELIINERCLGLDHYDTAKSYGTMALFYHDLNQTELALSHMPRALLLLGLLCGLEHPDVVATYINVAMMYLKIGEKNTAFRYLQEALKMNERLLGEENIQTAFCYHAFAIANNCLGIYDISLKNEMITCDILVKRLGEDDSKTKDSRNWIDIFKMLELQKNKGQALNSPSTKRAAMNMIKANPDFVQALKAIEAGGDSSTESSSVESFNNIVIKKIVAQASVESRKKAAATCFLKPPQIVHVLASTPFQYLLDIIKPS